MKPSKYSILIIPDNDAKDWRFNLSRKKIIALIFGLICILAVLLFLLIYGIPRLLKYNTMEAENKKFAQNRTKIIELTRDLNRMEQMDQLIRKTLGSELELNTKPERSNLSDSTTVNTTNGSGTVSYIENIPSRYPVEGYITRKKDTNNFYKMQNHYGIDIAVKAGEPIYASASGFVVFSGWTYDYGNYIILYHGDDYFTVYGHNKINFVETRDFVKRSDIIATSGSTGIASGPHLHYEIWKDGEALNPIEFFPNLRNKDMSVNYE